MNGRIRVRVDVMTHLDAKPDIGPAVESELQARLMNLVSVWQSARISRKFGSQILRISILYFLDC